MAQATLLHRATDGSPAIGTHMLPARYFAKRGTKPSPRPSVRVIQTAEIDELKLLFTRGGGIFVAQPNALTDAVMFKELDDVLAVQERRRAASRLFSQRGAFTDRFCAAANMVLCELAMLGVVSEPVCGSVVGYAEVLAKEAMVRGSSGSREHYPERTMTMTFSTMREDFSFHTVTDPSSLSKACKLRRVRKLLDCSETMPQFVLCAYYWYSRRQFAEAALSAFIVVEQLVDVYWQQMTASRPAKQRERMRDHRNYGVATRLDVLEQLGCLPTALTDAAHEGRKQRNDIAHRGRASSTSAALCARAMHDFLVHFLDEEVAELQAADTTFW